MPPVQPTPIDPRGPRFGAVVTSVVLALVLVLGPGVPALALLVIQIVAFALGSLIGISAQPYGIVFRRLVRPRLRAPRDVEDPRPPRFAQTVGLVFALAGLAGLIWAPVLFYVAVGIALVAALLNAVFDFCLGCEVYLLSRRVAGRPLGSSGSGAGA